MRLLNQKGVIHILSGLLIVVLLAISLGFYLFFKGKTVNDENKSDKTYADLDVNLSDHDDTAEGIRKAAYAAIDLSASISKLKVDAAVALWCNMPDEQKEQAKQALLSIITSSKTAFKSQNLDIDNAMKNILNSGE